MAQTGTITALFTDIVGSTNYLARLGDRDWDAVRRKHFSVLREALSAHNGTEVKNTGDGLMAVFTSAVGAVDCALLMQELARRVLVAGAPVGLRIGMSAGEATHDRGDWFGTPVVEAARLCGLAEANTAWASQLVQVLAGSQARAHFVSLGPQLLKGFDAPIETVEIQPPSGPRDSMFAHVDRVDDSGDQLLGALDYWGSLAAIRRMRAAVVAELALVPGDAVCDIGCGTGSELAHLARLVGEHGTAIGVEPSAAMIAATEARCSDEGVAVELHQRDGRDTQLSSGRCDSVRMERVLQHVGDAAAFLDEAKRITRPGGRVVVADTDWGSLMIRPGNRDLIRRFKSAMETGPMAEPWAGRLLHGAMLDCGLLDVKSQMFAIDAGPGVTAAFAPMFDRFVAAHLATRTEVDDLVADIDTGLERGEPLFSFVMFVAAGGVPD